MSKYTEHRDDFILEYWHKDFTFGFKVEDIIIDHNTEHFHLVIFENDLFGKVMMLDGATQLTTRDVHVYHEMMTHPAILSHGKVEEVLIIGGGDGGTAREVLRHQNINVTQVEIDQSVVDLSIKHLPEVSDGAYDSKRMNLIIADGVDYVKAADKKYDLIIIDSTDPVGPAKALFEADFFAACKKALKPDGIFINQLGLPYLQPDELNSAMKSFVQIYKSPRAFLTTVPTYVVSPMVFGWCSDKEYPHDANVIRERYKDSNIATKHYNPEVHVAAFAIPNEIEEIFTPHK